MRDLAQRFSVEVINKETGDIVELTADMDVKTAGHFYPALKVLAERAKAVLQQELDARRGALPRVEANLGGHWYEMTQETSPEYNAPLLHTALSPFVAEGLITQDELDIAVAQIVTWSTNGTRLNALRKRGQAIADTIDKHMTRKPKSPSFGLKS